MAQKEYIIVSTIGDLTSKIIADWILYFGGKPQLFYTELENLEIDKIELSNQKRLSSFKSSSTRSFSSHTEYIVCFRRGMIRLNKGTNSRANPGNFIDIENRVKYFFTTFELAQKEIIDHFFSSGITYGRDNESRTNKINNLKIASQIGLNIPDSIVTTQKSHLLKWSRSKNQIITKSLDIGMFFGDASNNKMYQQLTTKIDIKDIKDYPEEFPPTLFQERLEKIIELRIFYLDGKVWPSAVISQSQNNTIDDCRNYDPNKMNRIVPFTIPNALKKKIVRFMEAINMITGSLDFVVAKNGKYYFLEVNPGGQFSGVSEKCNYNLEKEFAKNMMHYGSK